MKNILAVDNDRIILNTMTRLLQKEGHHVVTAENALDALDVLRSFNPDIIFVDLIMPMIDGSKFCQIIYHTEGFEHVKLVILSAIAAEERVDLSCWGVSAYIAKGPLNEMKPNILKVIEDLDRDPPVDLTEKIIGGEHMHPRTITQELLVAKNHLETILEKMSEGVVGFNADGRIVYANPSMIRLLGIPEDELYGSRFIDLFSAADHETIGSLMEKNGRSDSPAMASPISLRGHLITLDFHSATEYGFTSVIVNDVTEKNRLERQLRQSQKIEAIGTLAGGIAHDFNNLLMAILGNTSLMLMDSGPEDPHYNRLKAVEKQVESGKALTEQLLGYARKGRYHIQAVCLNRLLQETLDRFGRIRKEIRVHLDVEPDLYTVNADPGQIEQVILNLFFNAAEAMPGGGDLYFRTLNATHREMAGDTYTPLPGKYVLLQCQDRGAGIDRETQRRIFDPFFTTKEMGRGLGLAAVYGIVKGHGGYIEVMSEQQEGTIFSVYLPAGEAPVRQAGDAPAHILKGNETILFVDDEDIVLKAVTAMLERMGYFVIQSSGGSGTLQTFKRYQETIDLVVLDLVMPGMSGEELFDRIRQIRPDVRVLLSSGYSIDAQATKILKRGANGFIQKPFSMKDLSLKIRSVLDETGRSTESLPPFT